MTRFTASSSFVFASARRVMRRQSFMSTRQMTKITAAASMLPSEKPPTSIASSSVSVSMMVFSGARVSSISASGISLTS